MGNNEELKQRAARKVLQAVLIIVGVYGTMLALVLWVIPSLIQWAIP